MKVAVFFGTGYEEIEALSVIDVLRRGKVDVKMVGVNGRSVTSSRGVNIHMDTTVEEVNFAELDFLVLPGGVPGVDHLAECTLLMEQLKQFKAEDKWLAAICAGPSILGQIGLLNGEKATCYPGYEDKLKGCEYIGDGVVVSHHIVTGKGAGYSLDFAFKLLEVIKGIECANQVKRGMLII